jgi:hypothetical protein
MQSGLPAYETVTVNAAAKGKGEEGKWMNEIQTAMRSLNSSQNSDHCKLFFKLMSVV